PSPRPPRPAGAGARGDAAPVAGGPARGDRSTLPGAGLSLRDPRPPGLPQRERQRGTEVDREKVRELLEAVAAGALAPELALARLRDLPVEDRRFARVDLHRSLRHGVPEAVFWQGK